jgi:hypothetical protein
MLAYPRHAGERARGDPSPIVVAVAGEVLNDDLGVWKCVAKFGL